MINRPRHALLAVGTLVFAIGCGGDSGGPPPVATVTVSPPAGDVVVGLTTQLTATPKDAKGNALTGKTTAWASSATAVATVSNTGLVTGVTPGSATITATIDGKNGSQSVNVIPVPVATVTVTAAVGTIQINQTTQATAVVRDASNNVLTGRTVSWGSDNPSVATVSNTGVVTGLTAGTATITATSENKSGSTPITVTGGNPADAPTITVITPATIVEGQTATISGTKFGASPAANVVRVGGVSAVVSAATATTLQITVPKLNCKPAQNISVDVTVAGTTSAAKAQPFAPASTFSLAVGQQTLITNPTDFCIQFPASGANEKYLIGVQSVTDVVTSVVPATITGEVPAGAFVASRATIANGPVYSASLASPVDGAQALRFAKHREVEATLIDQDRARFAAHVGSFHAAALRSAGRAPRSQLAAAPTVPATAKVGDVLTIRMPNRASTNSCTNTISLPVTVKAVGQHGIILEDNANPTGGFSATDYQTFSDRFDSQIYATDAAYFGDPTDFDNNSRVAIVITKEVNKVPNLLGEVLFADLDPIDCPNANSGEFFYGKAPDPNGTAGSKYLAADALNDAPIIIAHEFAHVIQIGRRSTYQAATAFQATWELEGQATFAEEVNGYTATGLTPGQNLGFAIGFNSPQTQPISWFVDGFVDLIVYYGFLARDTHAVGAPEQCSWLGTQAQGNSGPCIPGREPYGVPWSFLRYLSDQYGGQFPGGETGLHRALIDNAFTGYATISSVIGQPIDVLLTRWAAMLYADDRIAGVDAKLTMPSWNLVSMENGIVPTGHLTPYDHQFAAFNRQVSIRGGSTAYFTVSGNGRSATGIRARDQADGALPIFMRMWVVRMQ
jgi:uncharacterized protein YjdB